ncbi:MAG: hypothetical protein ACLU38_08800 [Dysosmobacter sp.]
MNDSTVQGHPQAEGQPTASICGSPACTAGDPDTLPATVRSTPLSYVPAIAAGGQKTIAFGDFSYYWIG